MPESVSPEVEGGAIHLVPLYMREGFGWSSSLLVDDSAMIKGPYTAYKQLFIMKDTQKM